MAGETATVWAVREVEALPRGASTSELLAGATAVLHEVVDFDACGNTATDPDTLLPSAATHIEGLPGWSCRPYWDTEYLHDDVLSFAEVAGRGGAAESLHRATDQRPWESARHREVLQALDLDAELRATATVDGATYGVLDLMRGAGAGDFAEDDLRLVDAVLPVLGRRLRRAFVSMPTSAEPLPADAAVVILDEDGDVLSMTEAAREMLDLVPEPSVTHPEPNRYLGGIVHAMWARARFLSAGFDAPDASARIRLHDGRHMALHARCTRTPAGGMGHTVIVLEPTRRSLLGPLVLAAHDVTAREEEIVARLLHGDSAQQIGSALGISIHTVRTHTKRIHEKLGINSRAELARLFIDEVFLTSATVTTGGHGT